MNKARIGPSVELSAVIVRACSSCGGKRELSKPCASCGSLDPAEVRDLGVIASSQRNWWKRLKWKLWQYRAAQRRIRRVNTERG